MLESSEAFSGFAVPDLEQAKQFYGETLGLKVTDLDEDVLLQLELAGGRNVLLYVKPDHAPSNYTILNFPVDDIDAVVDGLAERGVQFERYDDFDQDDKGIFRGEGPLIAWFKDPAGNILSVLKEG
jgi:catechol 2,3-dioxygenase-like lactoylglutathione lyase family enzyme